jgi:hypothetical protein
LKILPPKRTLSYIKTPVDRERAGEEPDIRLTKGHFWKVEFFVNWFD